MKRGTVLLLALFVVLLHACNKTKTNPKERHLVIRYYRNNKINNTDSLVLDKLVLNDTTTFIYRNAADTLEFSFKKTNENDSSIFLLGHKCPLVSSRSINIDDRAYYILKYYYDIENSYDEESSFFYNNDYGLLVGFNYGWANLIFSMQYDKVSELLVDSILNDSSGFYTRRIPPLVPLDSITQRIDKFTSDIK